MHWVVRLIDFVLHFDKHLAEFVATYGVWVYGFLFGIVFAETGLVVTPFCPATRCCSPPARSPRLPAAGSIRGFSLPC
jgi:membrane-associated protein